MSDKEPCKYIQKVMSGWFLDAPLAHIHRDNVLSWTGWAYFCKNVTDMTEEEVKENRELVSYIETMADWTFPEG
jgi:hypothetical protein